MASQPTGAAEPIDVAAALADLESRVRQRRRLLGMDDPSAADDLRAVSDLWRVSAHWPITWTTPIIGRWLALAKRLARILLRWYINPIVDQQNDFNAAVARAFVRVAAQQEALLRTVAELEARLAALPPSTSAADAPAAGDTGGRKPADRGS